VFSILYLIIKKNRASFKNLRLSFKSNKRVNDKSVFQLQMKSWLPLKIKKKYHCKRNDSLNINESILQNMVIHFRS